MLALCLASIGSFGESGMRGALPWPAITLPMSSAVIPGKFLSAMGCSFYRSDAGNAFPAVGAGMYYLKFLSEGLMGKREKQRWWEKHRDRVSSVLVCFVVRHL